ncbi:hypothetical protein [Nocardioides taihuensis]|uniref:MFS transporter n=1 Tax=Nocardioides taihuensis TaxID=1835606 RepID=A0ABW0BF76_9ACTN
MTRLILLRLATFAAVVLGLALLLPTPADAIPGFSDCKEAPTPEVPGRGIAGFFDQTPESLPPQADPFESGSSTTIYQQYGYAGLRWHTYDLGCGPEAMRQPDAVIGTAMSNWAMQAPLALTALTGSLTKVAFNPSFLTGLDPSVEQVSTALHDSLFASWIPVVIAALGVLIIFKARRASLATTAAAVGWALMVILITTALFRWPVEAGHAADDTVTSTLGAVVSELDGHGGNVDPGTAVASGVHDQILYRSWLAGTLGSADSETARKYGPELFRSQALTWREAAVLESDPEEGQQIIEDKQDAWKSTAERIEDEDPEAYEYLTGRRSETRIGYAMLATVGTFLALPFLLLSALLLVGCYLIVRLGVMLFPAFATLGAFPASRGLVVGLARTVGAAVINAIIFGVGAGVTVAVLGLLLDPQGAPAWLGLVLMPIFSLIMWVALRPFRRLTSMVSADGDHFRSTAGGIGSTARSGGRLAKDVTKIGVAAATGGAAAGAVVANAQEEAKPAPPERAEARPTPVSPARRPTGALPAGRPAPATESQAPRTPEPPAPRQGPGPTTDRSAPRHRELEPGFVPTPSGGTVPMPPTEPEWYDGEDVYPIYHPSDDLEAS